MVQAYLNKSALFAEENAGESPAIVDEDEQIISDLTPEQSEPQVEQSKSESSKQTMPETFDFTYVIIGKGPAAFFAAQAIRQHDNDAPVGDISFFQGFPKFERKFASIMRTF